MWLLLACREPAPPTRDPDPVPHSGRHTGHTGAEPLAHSASSASHTGEPAPCADLPDSPLSQTSLAIETTEDFDFDPLGRLVYVDWNGNLMAADLQADATLVSPGTTYEDVRGVQVVSTGEVLLNYISRGTTARVDLQTGSRTNYLTGLSGPNALEVGHDDVIYVTETEYPGQVVYHDPRSDTRGVVASGFVYPNGLALSQDQLTLYVADDYLGIFAVHRTDADTQDWDPVLERVFEPGYGVAYDALETDVCGNLYAIGFYTGELYRFDPTTREVKRLIDLDDPGSLLWNAIRWGSNRGGWRRDTLYVTSRNRIFALELGVDGRDQPVDLAP